MQACVSLYSSGIFAVGKCCCHKSPCDIVQFYFSIESISSYTSVLFGKRKDPVGLSNGEKVVGKMVTATRRSRSVPTVFNQYGDI